MDDEVQIQREKLSSLIGKEISDVIDGPNNGIYFIGPNGHVFALVNRDDIFDAYGNRFEDDI